MAPNTIVDPASVCPRQEALAAFARGGLSDKESETLADHLVGCSSCSSVLKELESGADTPCTLLKRSLQEKPFQAEPEYQGMESCAEAIPMAASSAGSQSTAPRAADLASLPQGPALPKSLDVYQIGDRLGWGGMGVVYQAWHTVLNKPVALKMLRPDRLNDDTRRRFFREIKAVGRLNHPNIVQAMDAREVQGFHFLVMEFVEGIDLSRLVQEHGPLRVADACELIRQAAIGLQYVHDQGQVHRDIKPRNLMVTPAGQVKVLDLGLALLYGEHPADEELTSEGQVMGTVEYMAPEQGEDAHRVTARADIYSLGCTLYQLLTGQVPFGPPRYRTALQKVLAHRSVAVPPVRNYRPEIPAGLVAILDRMLAKEPTQRYAASAEVVRALEPFAAGSDLPGLAALPRGKDPQILDMAGVQGGWKPLAETRPRELQADIETARRPPRLRRVLLRAVRQVSSWRPRVLVSLGFLACASAFATVLWFNGKVEQSADPVRTAAAKVQTTIRDLDTIPRHLLFYLFDARPLPIGYGEEVPRLWHWDRDPRDHTILNVKGGETLLFPVGKTNRSSFVFGADVEQLPWTSDVGVFWGYHENAAAKKASVPGREFAWFQVLSVGDDYAREQGHRFHVKREKCSLAYNAQGVVVLATRVTLARQDVPRFSQGRQAFWMQTQGDKLRYTRLGSVDLKALYSDAANNSFKSEPYKGVLGVVSFSQLATYSNVRFGPASDN